MCDVMKVERTAASIRGLAAAGTKVNYKVYINFEPASETVVHALVAH